MSQVQPPPFGRPPARSSGLAASFFFLFIGAAVGAGFGVTADRFFGDKQPAPVGTKAEPLLEDRTDELLAKLDAIESRITELERLPESISKYLPILESHLLTVVESQFNDRISRIASIPNFKQFHTKPKPKK